MLVLSLSSRHPEHAGPEGGGLVEAGVVPVLTVGGRGLRLQVLRGGEARVAPGLTDGWKLKF